MSKELEDILTRFEDYKGKDESKWENCLTKWQAIEALHTLITQARQEGKAVGRQIERRLYTQMGRRITYRKQQYIAYEFNWWERKKVELEKGVKDGE